MKRLILMILCLVSIAAFGCGKKGDKENKDQTQVAPPTPPPVTKPAELDDKDIPVPGDFEAQAEKDITADNYKKALDELEAEVDSDQ